MLQVSWIACWMGKDRTRYLSFPLSCESQAQKDRQKYDLARELSKNIDNIRQKYKENLTSKIMKIRQEAVAMYFIDNVSYC